MNFNFSHPFKSKIFHNKLNSSSLYSSVTEHTSPLISKYKPEQATKIIINTHWSGRRRTYFKSWTYPKTILTTIHSPSNRIPISTKWNDIALYRLKRPIGKSFRTSISLLSLMSLFYSGSLRTFAKIAFDITEESSCFNIFFGQWI